MKGDVKPVSDYKWYVIISGVLGTVYCLTLMPGTGGYGDIAKFQFVGYVLGTPHATGYPTYILISNLFTRIFPFFTLAYRVNLLSALFTIASSLFLFHMLNAHYRTTKTVACATAISFGFMITTWAASLSAEVYTLHLLFVTAILTLVLRWSDRGETRYFLLAAFLYAISFGNHLASILLLPGLIFIVWATNRRVILHRRLVSAVLLFLLLGAAQYLYLVMRTYSTDATYLEIQAPDFATLWWYASGGPFRGMLFAFSLSEVWYERIPLIASLVLKEISWSIPLVFIGIFSLTPAREKIFLIITATSIVFFSINYAVWEIHNYLIPFYLVLSIFLGLGLNRLAVICVDRSLLVGRYLIWLVPLFFLFSNYLSVDKSAFTEDALYAEKILEIVERDAIIISPNYNNSEHFWYYLIGEGRGKNNIYLMHHYRTFAVKDYLRKDIPFYLTEQRIDVPIGLHVYCFSEKQKNELVEIGLKAQLVSDGLYQIR